MAIGKGRWKKERETGRKRDEREKREKTEKRGKM